MIQVFHNIPKIIFRTNLYLKLNFLFQFFQNHNIFLFYPKGEIIGRYQLIGNLDALHLFPTLKMDCILGSLLLMDAFFHPLAIIIL